MFRQSENYSENPTSSIFNPEKQLTSLGISNKFYEPLLRKTDN